jgi:transposase
MEWHKIRLTERELKEIHNAEKQVDKPQLLKRLQCIKLKHEKWKHQKIANFLGIHLETVSRWIKIYKEKGIQELLQWGYKGKVSVLTLDQQEKIIERNRENPFPVAKDAMQYIKNQFGVGFHLHYVQKLLKKNFSFHTRNLS